MAAPNICSRCGFSNQPSSAFCEKCGNSLAPGAMSPAGATAPPYWGPPSGGSPYGYMAGMETSRQIDRTKLGVLLLLIGALIGWIPYVNIIAFILFLIGAIMVILGRRAFGPDHSRNVVLSVVLFLVGIVALIAVVGYFAFQLFAAIGPTLTQTNPDPAVVADALRSAINGLLIGSVIVAAILGSAYVLFTYAIQGRTGRMILWAAYVAYVAIAIAVAVILSAEIADVVAQAVATRPPNTASITAFQARQTLLGVLNIIPYLLFAAAFYLVWSRISRGELPARAALVTPPSPPPSTGLG